MRPLLLALALLALAVPATSPSAAACHPSLNPDLDVPGVARVRGEVDMGCSHLPPYTACVTVAWQFIPAPPTTVCAPQ